MMFDGIIQKLDNYFSKDEEEQIDKQRLTIKSLQTQLESREDHIFKLGSDIALLQKSLSEAKEMSLMAYLAAKEEAIGDVLNNNRTKMKSSIRKHLGRPLSYWCLDNNDKVPNISIEGESYDQIANKALNYVIDYMTYTPDTKETWQSANTSLTRKKGDCFAGYEEIYTEDGIKRIDQIKEGDKILSYDFKTKKYINKKVIAHWVKGKLPIKRVHLRNGQSFDVTEDHPMWSRIGQKNSIYEKTPLSKIDLSRWWKRKIPIAKLIPYKKSKPLFPIDLYRVIGHYIAEGWSEPGKVSSSGYELIEDIIPLLEKHNIPFSEYTNNSGVPCIRFLKGEFKDYLKGLKRNSRDITLYEEIITLPEEYLEELIYGMWLGDGTKNIGKNQYNKEWVYTTSSKQLSDDIQRIGLQLGRTFHIWKQENHKGVGNNPIYRITFNPNSHFMKDFGYEGISEVSISYIEKLEETMMYDLTVEDTHTVILKNGSILHQCEDGAILMYNIMAKSGIPAHRVRLNAGEVQGGGHAYITYYSDVRGWVILDWCYWPNAAKNLRQRWSTAKRYFGIWFSWNAEFVWQNIPGGGIL